MKLVTPVQLTLIFERGEDGWWTASVAEVPGAFCRARTREEARIGAWDSLDQTLASFRQEALSEKRPQTEIESLKLTPA